MTSVQITPVTPAELPRVRALAYQIWPEAYAGVLPAERIGPMLDEIYALKTLAADIAQRGHAYWLAGDGRGDLGFVSAFAEGERLWIKKIYLLEAARGLGLGKRLIATARAHFGPHLAVALNVNDGNARAIAFYRAQGFAIEARVPVRMGPYDFTDYVMVRPADAG